jgi:uncharacterized protein (TIGR02266 family)
VVEKRTNARYPVIADIEYSGAGVRHIGRVSDLSTGGIFVDTINPLPEGTHLAFSFALPGDQTGNPIIGEGVVAWIQPMLGMGVRFTSLPDEDAERVRAFIKSF